MLPVVGGDFQVPLVTGGSTRYVNLDYAASAPALVSVAQHVSELMQSYASVHRGAGWASRLSTAAYENARTIVGDFLNARADDLVIFTRNTTDALNLLASVVPGDTVVLDIEHHANLLPWIDRSARVVQAGDTLEETKDAVERELASKPAALLTVTGASNVTGELLPLAEFAAIAHRHGARIAVDAAQLVAHRRIDLLADRIDYLAFSGHKAYAPFGAGVLVGRADWLDAGTPYLLGGGAVRTASLGEVSWKSGPARHEAGSPNVLGVVALAEALRVLDRLGQERWYAHEAELRERLVDGLRELPGVDVHRIFDDSVGVVGVVSFTIAGADSGLVANYLSAEHGIGVRDGLFCAHPLLQRLGGGVPALRASFGLGSTTADVDALLGALRAFVADGPQWRYERVGGRWDVVDDPRPRPDWAPADADDSYGCAA